MRQEPGASKDNGQGPTSAAGCVGEAGRGSARRSIAIMQPYFIPYAGYFRLFAAADLFVIYDCVQFPRRGWLHRNQLVTRAGETDWLTLPLDKAPREALIGELRFRNDAALDMQRQMRRFPALDSPLVAGKPLVDRMAAPMGTPLDHIVGLMELACAALGLPWSVTRSSGMDLPRDLKGQDRILAIARAYGATHYVNAPGGRALYEPDAFARAGIELGFLPAYAGDTASIAQRLATEDAASIARELRAQAHILP